jgi:RNA polymerase sigma factor (sigma-70 family)
MNSEQATPLNIQTAERAIAPRDEIVSASPAESPVTFEELHAIYSRRLFRTIVRITKSPEDAEDALQDTLLRAHLALGTFEGRSSIYSWLTRIAVNSALMILRKRRARPEVRNNVRLKSRRAETIDPATVYEISGVRMRTLHLLMICGVIAGTTALQAQEVRSQPPDDLGCASLSDDCTSGSSAGRCCLQGRTCSRRSCEVNEGS